MTNTNNRVNKNSNDNIYSTMNSVSFIAAELERQMSFIVAELERQNIYVNKRLFSDICYNTNYHGIFTGIAERVSREKFTCLYLIYNELRVRHDSDLLAFYAALTHCVLTHEEISLVINHTSHDAVRLLKNHQHYDHYERAAMFTSIILGICAAVLQHL